MAKNKAEENNEDWGDFMTAEQREAYVERERKRKAKQQQTLEDMMAEWRDIKIELGPFLDRLKVLEKDIKNHVRDTGETIDIEGAGIKITRGYTKEVVKREEFLEYARNKKYLHKFIETKTVSPGIGLKIYK